MTENEQLAKVFTDAYVDKYLEQYPWVSRKQFEEDFSWETMSQDVRDRQIAGIVAVRNELSKILATKFYFM